MVLAPFLGPSTFGFLPAVAFLLSLIEPWAIVAEIARFQMGESFDTRTRWKILENKKFGIWGCKPQASGVGKAEWTVLARVHAAALT
jgi:hypothetical protein